MGIKQAVVESYHGTDSLTDLKGQPKVIIGVSLLSEGEEEW